MSLSSLPCLAGPLLDASPTATRLALCVVLCELRPAFLPKAQVGKHHRAISRSGRVLLASAWPLDALPGRTVRLHLSVWHRRSLPDDPPRPHGLLLGAWPAAAGSTPTCDAIVADTPAADGLLFLELGGLRVLTLVASAADSGPVTG